MTYPYLEITPAIRRPIINIIIKSDTNFAIYPVLIDSGVDYCIFNLEVAKSLGIKLTKSVIKFLGVGKGKVTGRWGKIEFKIGSHSYETSVLFANISKFNHGILGQQGFLDHFDVKLSYQKQIIEIKLTES